MSYIMAAATQMFNFMFHISSGANDPVAAGVVPQVISLIIQNDYLLLGLAFLVCGSAVSYLSKVIRG